MSIREDRHCPTCGRETSHRLVARTRLHLGIKHKWDCDECEYRTVSIDPDPVL